jgi:hypothetical protein
MVGMQLEQEHATCYGFDDGLLWRSLGNRLGINWKSLGNHRGQSITNYGLSYYGSPVPQASTGRGSSSDLSSNPRMSSDVGDLDRTSNIPAGFVKLVQQ